ncbi:hypothetical protein Tco_0460377, partial [Tanacetum coccineum]
VLVPAGSSSNVLADYVPAGSSSNVPAELCFCWSCSRSC